MARVAVARRWVLRLAIQYRLPEPTRQAHIFVTALKTGSTSR